MACFELIPRRIPTSFSLSKFSSGAKYVHYSVPFLMMLVLGNEWAVTNQMILWIQTRMRGKFWVQGIECGQKMSLNGSYSNCNSSEAFVLLRWSLFYWVSSSIKVNYPTSMSETSRAVNKWIWKLLYKYKAFLFSSSIYPWYNVEPQSGILWWWWFNKVIYLNRV